MANKNTPARVPNFPAVLEVTPVNAPVRKLLKTFLGTLASGLPEIPFRVSDSVFS